MMDIILARSLMDSSLNKLENSLQSGKIDEVKGEVEEYHQISQDVFPLLPKEEVIDYHSKFSNLVDSYFKKQNSLKNGEQK